MTTLEIDAPQLRATELIARPGTLPSVVFPMTPTSDPDVEGIWRYLAEPAEFFGVPMPGVDDLAAAIAVFARAFAAAGPPLIAANVTIAETADAPRILVTGSTVQPLHTAAVRVAAGDPPFRPIHQATDAWWRRMAARTTSLAETDQCERWLTAHGLADGLADGVPLLGALVVETDHGLVAVENPEPASVLEQLARIGVIAELARVPACPTGARRAWWLSPRYQTHPVAELDTATMPVDAGAAPPFARWS